MNKVAEQAKLVQEALRAGKAVALVVPGADFWDRTVGTLIPEGLKITARHARYIKFENGAVLSFVPSWHPNGARGTRISLALYRSHGVEIHELALSPPQLEREKEILRYLKSHGVEMRELELP